MVINNIFQTPVFSFNVINDNNSLISYIEECSKNKGRVLSNVGGWQSNDIVHDDMYRPLFKNISNEMIKLKEILKLKVNKKLVIDSAWSNINYYKDFNKTHWHPKAFLSGVYYIKAPENCGNIEFEHPGLDCMYGCDWEIDNFEDNETNTLMSKTWIMPAKENILYIFPAWLKHSVTSNLSNEKRISLAFNTSII